MILIPTMVLLLIAAELWRRGACADDAEIAERAHGGDNSGWLLAILLVGGGLLVALLITGTVEGRL